MLLSQREPWDAVAEGYDATTRLPLRAFSEHALEWTDLDDDAAILDVACGPGTLAELAASNDRRMLLTDWSDAMLDVARRRTADLPNVTLDKRDGQNLGVDAEFDAAFSMFGLMFFPDRHAGLTSMLQALKPGGVGVVSTWVPWEEASAMQRGVGAALAAFPPKEETPVPQNPFDTIDVVKAEMETAGFVDVEVERVALAFQWTVDEMWALVADGFAPFALARQSMPDDEWNAGAERGLAWLRENHGADDKLEYVALIGKGRRRP